MPAPKPPEKIDQVLQMLRSAFPTVPFNANRAAGTIAGGGITVSAAEIERTMPQILALVAPRLKAIEVANEEAARAKAAQG